MVRDNYRHHGRYSCWIKDLCGVKNRHAAENEEMARTDLLIFGDENEGLEIID